MTRLFNNKPKVILVAEDNPADQELLKRIFEKHGVNAEMHIVDDGIDLLNYLKAKTNSMPKPSNPRPDIILLDINMPRMDGKQALKAIKEDKNLKDIPVIMFTTSHHERDINESYFLGASSYITKPADIEEFDQFVKHFNDYWFSTVKLPIKNND
ncbi:MAG: response regulator [Spirochaetota bacterium]|nr:response regulator [Spirochaetota bacterium]